MQPETITADLVYEFDSRPQTGESMQIAPGLYWLRMHLPFSLAHINLWLLDESDSWSVVDTGVAVDQCKAIWNETFTGTMRGHPISRVIATHLHPDHVGCAGWLTDLFDAPLWMSRDEYLLARILVADTGRSTPEEGDRFYTAAGFAANQLEHYHRMFGMFGKYVAPLPESFRRLCDGDMLDIGPYQWQVIVGKGHSPEHVCLYSAELNSLISGDQLLPTISSNVSVFPTEPDADPLADWLQSLRMLKTRVPEDVLVLPAHGNPFRGAHRRLDVLIREHEDSLEKLERYCTKPRRAVDLFSTLFRSAINNNNLIMATGESIAHLNYLRNTGRMQVSRDAGGVDWYQTTG